MSWWSSTVQQCCCTSCWAGVALTRLQGRTWGGRSERLRTISLPPHLKPAAGQQDRNILVTWTVYRGENKKKLTVKCVKINLCFDSLVTNHCFPVCCRGQLQMTGRQNQSTRLIRAKIMTDWSTFINKWLAIAAGEENIKEIRLRPWSRMQGDF